MLRRAQPGGPAPKGWLFVPSPRVAANFLFPFLLAPVVISYVLRFLVSFFFFASFDFGFLTWKDRGVEGSS